MAESQRIVHQPIHPDVLPRLDTEYVTFHNDHIAYIVPPHTLPWNSDIRKLPHIPGSSPMVEVGDVKDIALEHCKIRVYTPEGSPPDEGWPVFLYMHGGGWTLGSLDTHASFAARQCKEHRCLTICLDYRLAPEHPYPAAVIDTVDAVKWIYQHGKSELNANVNKIAVGGSSSGGNLAAIVSLRAQELDPPIPIIFQLLVVPVTDNVASESGEVYPSWREMKDTVWLNTGRMLWFRNNYLPDPATRTNWDNSPIYAPQKLLAKAPPAWVGICEMDILRDEGIAYGEKLRGLGVKVEIKQYKGVPHQTLGMDGVMSVARIMVADATKALGDAFKAC
ncbi:alpha/beta hydrolase fold-domain-containing protein [Chiua virens]|nr:alpha/beta hydrolase fold-domain-containing protein [Chiua virens]